MAELTPIGDRLDALVVAACIDDGDLVTSAMVILSVLEPDDNMPRLCIATSEGLSWIEQAGLLRIAEQITSGMPLADDDEDDE